MEEIRNWWEVPSIAHFCSLFRAAFGLTDFEIEDLEDALVIDGSNEEGNNRFLADLHARLLRGLYGIKDITAENFEPYLSQVLKIRWEDELGKKNPLADKEYSKLTTREKVDILHNLCDFRLDVEDVPELLKGLDADSLRVEPLGFDAEGRTFWYFYGTRLYREEKPAQADNKTNKKSKKKKKMEAKNKKKKVKVKKKKKAKGSSSDSESEESSPSSELPSSDYADDEDENDDEQEADSEDAQKKQRPSWTVVCSTEEEWQELAESFKKSKNKDEKMLYETLSVDFVPEIGKMIEAKDKAMRKKLLMEMAPRRVSDRIASKVQGKEEDSEQEENEKQKERERAAEERKKEEEEREREKKQQAEKRQQERARRARNREERQWLMASGEYVPEELKMSFNREEESKDSDDAEKRPPSTRNKTAGEGGDIGLEDRDEDLYTGMYKVLDALKKHNNAWPFLEPVEESYAPQYYEIIEEPMDLSTIEQKLDDSKYNSLSEFSADMKLMFENCLDYNGPDSMYTKMANSLEAAFNRQLKKHFPEDDDNSDEDFEEELARKGSKKDKKKGVTGSATEMFRGGHPADEHGFASKMAPSGMQSMFPNHMMPNAMANGGMMPSHHPSRMPFPGPPHFAPDGRPLYPPQFYQNAFNQAAFARFGMPQPGPQYNRFRYPQGNPMGQMAQMGQPPQSSHYPPQRMPGRMPFQYRMPGAGASGNMELNVRENDMNSPNQTEQAKQLSPQQTAPVSTSGEPTPSSVTGGTERGRYSQQQPHGPPPYYRPQSFNQAFMGYPRNGAMPYGAPEGGPYGQPMVQGREPMVPGREPMVPGRESMVPGREPMVPGREAMVAGREPWRLDRRTPETAPQRVPSTEGPFREEAKPTNPPELSKDQALNFAGGHQLESGSDSEEEQEDKEEQQQQHRDLQTNGREESSVEGIQQTKSRVPATLSISHILSGASRDDQQHLEGAKMREAPVQGAPQGPPSMHPASARHVIRSPEDRERFAASNEHMNRVPGNLPGRASYENVPGRGPFGMAPNEGLERVSSGPHGPDPRRPESREHAFGMKFNDRTLLGNVAESVIKKAPQNNTDTDFYRKMPELRPIKESEVEEKQSRERAMEGVSENGHLEPGKTDTQRMPAGEVNKHLKEGERLTPLKNWPEVQPGSFLQELNDVGPPTAGNLNDKPDPEKNHRLPFTSMLRGLSPSQGSPENRGQFLSMEAANRERMRENMMAGNFLHSPEEKHERFNPARAADMSTYAAMYANKRPSEMMPPLQYRPNLSAMAHQRNMESGQMPPGANSQFVDLNSVPYRYPSGLPGRESLTREQMFYLEQQQQQRRQQMASSMDAAMMAGGQPERMMGYGGMLRQQQLFNAAYASHMRNGEFPRFPGNEEIPAKMARFS